MAALLARPRPKLSVDTQKPRGVSTLPEVKCSKCGVGVPLDELGDHECVEAPTAATPAPAPATPVLLQIQAPKTPAITPPASRSNVPSLSPSIGQPRLRRSFTDDGAVTDRHSRPPSPSVTSNQHLKPPMSGATLSPNVNSPRIRSASTPASYIQSESAVVEDMVDSPSSMATPRGGPLSSPFTPISPYPPYSPDTKSGGTAGMAGVGRRAFHAAAHVALLSASQFRAGPQYMNVNIPGSYPSTSILPFR